MSLEYEMLALLLNIGANRYDAFKVAIQKSSEISRFPVDASSGAVRSPVNGKQTGEVLAQREIGAIGKHEFRRARLTRKIFN